MRLKDLPASLRSAYRKLRQNAIALGRVLAYSNSGDYQELELIHYSDLDNAAYMTNRTVLFDPRDN